MVLYKMEQQNIFSIFIRKILFRFFDCGILVLIFFGIFISTSLVLASVSVGTIDSTNKYAWGENLGWINFGCDECDVVITDTEITGYAWSRVYGWINLSPDTSGVVNDITGTLSGMAWGSNIGWIDFDGVTIGIDGEFTGYATVESNGSQINFNCANGASCASSDFKVSTDWRPLSARPSEGGSSGSRPSSNQSLVEPEFIPAKPISPTIPVVYPPSVIDTIIDILNPFDDAEPEETVYVPRVTPPSLSFQWNLMPVNAISEFVFAPLPYEIRTLAAKFPELNQTLNEVGVKRFSDLDKLATVNLNVPGLQDKEDLPPEFVFAKSPGDKFDFNVALSLGRSGEVNQSISLLPGKNVRLVVRPISTASSVTGYIMFKAATPKITAGPGTSILRSSLSASALLSTAGFVENVPANLPPVETKLVLSSFEYLDADGDGVYTADVTTPAVPGEYEVVTVIDYIDPVLGSRRMSLVTVIDPEGYVFEKNGDKETRIPKAVVSLYMKNNSGSETGEYKLWNAKDYLQENPQTTDVSGTYSFLVPEGTYYFEVKAPGYESFVGESFIVTAGGGVHQNIELKSTTNLFTNNWQTILIIIVLLLLVYNDIYRNRMRDKMRDGLRDESFHNLENQNVSN